MRKRLIIGLLGVAMLIVGTSAAEDVAASSDKKAPKVDVVFVLDTTGSMGGLIQAAKDKIWAIANTLATHDPAPDIRMGLVGYRDRLDVYITKQTNLTDDLDAVYAQLMEYQADGGDDTPESVNQALDEAVSKMDWRKDDDTYRVIFLVGDAPPHMDYEDDVKYMESCKRAAEAGIFVNTIQCGDLLETTPIWKDIASKAEGRYFRVEQEGSAILTETPFDKEMSELSVAMGNTLSYYGEAPAQAANELRLIQSEEIDRVASDSAKAQRAFFNASAAGAKNFIGTQELVNDFQNGAVDLTKIKDEELPEEFRGKDKAEIETILKQKADERAALQAKINDLAAKRQAHIEEKIKKNELKSEDSLDFAVFECIQEQSSKAGLAYKGGPKL